MNHILWYNRKVHRYTGRRLPPGGVNYLASQTYNAGNTQVLEGLEAVRMRPGMYIGTTSSRGLHHLLWEIVDNAIDEASNGFASTRTVP